MGQELWHMEYFFPMPSGITLPWMLLILKHHGQDDGFSSGKNVLEYSILC